MGIGDPCSWRGCCWASSSPTSLGTPALATGRACDPSLAPALAWLRAPPAIVGPDSAPKGFPSPLAWPGPAPPSTCSSEATHTLGPCPHAQHTPDRSAEHRNFIFKWEEQTWAKDKLPTGVVDSRGLARSLTPQDPHHPLRQRRSTSWEWLVGSCPHLQRAGRGAAVWGTLLEGVAPAFQPQKERVCGSVALEVKQGWGGPKMVSGREVVDSQGQGA